MAFSLSCRHTRMGFVSVVGSIAPAILALGIVSCGSSSSSGLHGGGDGGPHLGTGGTTSPEAGSSSGGGGHVGAGGSGAGGTTSSCVTNSDCSGSADCILGVCVPVATCKNSLDCGTTVCEPATHRCVECVTSADCSAGQDCLGNKCQIVTPCTSDKQCTPQGQLCDTALARCADCLSDTDCKSTDHCVAGACAPDVCIPGQASCDANAVVRCGASGGLDAPAPCAARQTCVHTGTTASCSPWICDPGLSACRGDTAVVCSADGLSAANSVDCTISNLKCVAGACSDKACVPSAQFCEGNVLKQCDTLGQTSSVIQTCGATQYCDVASPACRAELCSPGAKACDGTIATTCNATGSGYVAGGQDCTAKGQTCGQGLCQACGSGTGLQTSIRLVEVMVGTPEYVVLENQGACAVDLGGMMLSFNTSYVSGVPFAYTLPSQVLAAGAKVFVLDDTAAPQGTDILSSGNIDWQATYGGTVLLCKGPCTTVTNVIDALAFQGGQAPPPLPAPVTFAPALTTITTANEQQQSFQRTAFTGAYPTFRPTDWTVADAARPGSTGTTTTCPLTQPANGTTCTVVAGTCPYGAVTCTCDFPFSFTWLCQ